MSDYIINPSLVYWVNVVDGLKSAVDYIVQAIQSLK